MMQPNDDGRIWVPGEGRYENIPNDVYHQCWNALNFGRLKRFDRSPRAYRYWQDQWLRGESPDKRTPALARGSAIHCTVLEPDEFEARYDLFPEPSDTYVRKTAAEGKTTKGWPNTKECKELVADLTCGGRELLKREDWDSCMRVRDNLWDNDGSAARDLVQQITASEVSYVARDPETGLLCKIKVDLEAEHARISCDLKTTRDAHPDSFSRDLYNFDYHTSEAFYRRTLDTYSGMPYMQHVFLVVETVEPFETVVYKLVPAAALLGDAKVDQLMEKFAACQESDEGHGLGDSVHSINVPYWAYGRG